MITTTTQITTMETTTQITTMSTTPTFFTSPTMTTFQTPIDCCTIVELTLNNDAFESQSSRAGIYTYDGISNGFDHWIMDSNNGLQFIWYVSQHGWNVGPNPFGDEAGIVGLTELTCPTNQTIEWQYCNGTDLIASSDIILECMGTSSLL